ncbi:hypothetical protein OC834_002668 [Tilletia horrida]|nr:hypothetical protein OC834_002668 [Tilletia horrida]
MSFAGSSCCCSSAQHARRIGASVSRSAGIAPSSRHTFSSASSASAATSSSSRQRSASSPSDEAGSSKSSTSSRGARRQQYDPLAAWQPNRNHPMLPVQPEPMNWDGALSANLYCAPQLAQPPRVPLDVLAPFDPASADSLPPDAATAASQPGPLIVGAKHTLKHAVRANQLHLGSGARMVPIQTRRIEDGIAAAAARVPTVGFQAEKHERLTNYQGFSRVAEIRASGAPRPQAEAAVMGHLIAENSAGDYSDHVAQGPMLARLLRNTTPGKAIKKHSDAKVVGNAHEAVRIADQALALNPSMDQAAKQFILHAVRDRVDPPAPPVSAAPAAAQAAAPTSTAASAKDKKAKQQKKGK